jgi:hypothetical protein
MLKTTIVEIQRQLIGIKGIQSFNVFITTIGVETVVAPNMNVVRGGMLIGFIVNLGNRSNGVLVGSNLSRSSILPTTTTRIVGTPQMLFTNMIMTTHVNMTRNRPSMSSMAIRGYKNIMLQP